MSAKNPLLSPDFPALQLIRTGRRVRLAGRITLYFFIATIVAMVFVPWRQTARGTGFVVALNPQERPQPISSPAEGLVKSVKEGIREGSYVEKGEILLTIEPFASDAVAQLDEQIAQIKDKQTSAEASLKSAEAALLNQQEAGLQMADSLEQDYTEAEKKLAEAEDQLDVAKAEESDKLNQFMVTKNAAAAGLVAGVELYSKDQAWQQAVSKRAKQENAVKGARAVLKSKEKSNLSKLQEIEVKNEQADQKRLGEKQKLNSIKKDLIDLINKRDSMTERLEVPATRSGFIQQWSGLAGSQTVKKSDQLFVIVPDAKDLAFEMRVTGNDMPLVHEGDRVRLQFEGWPAVQFVGWPSVAVGTFGGKVNRVFPTDDGKGYFRVLVKPDKHFEGETDWPDNRYLRQGVRANGWVLLRRVPLGYEIWRQLNGFPPIVSDAEPGKSKSDKGSKIKLPKA